MKKRTLSLAVALAMVIAMLPAFAVNVQAAESWRQAYAEFLQRESFKDFAGIDEDTRFLFTLYDFDHNGIPEMILRFSSPNDSWGGPFHVYTFADNRMISLTEMEFSGLNLYKSDNTTFNGLFVSSGGWSDPYWHAWNYIEVLGGELQITHIEDEYYSLAEQKRVRNFTPSRIADEWQRINAIGLDDSGYTGWDNRTLTWEYINDDNIATHIYGSNADRHPVGITVIIDGQRVNFTNQQPTILYERTLVPVRGVFEDLGFNVSWNEQAQQVTLSRANDKIVISINSKIFTTNGVKHTLDVPAQIIGGSTMLPIRAVLESVGYTLSWNADTRTVVITTN